MTKLKKDAEYDVLVIGGGPAGMMAAGRAGELGAKVALIEKNDSLGKKLLITGGGRCNLTNAEIDTRKFLANLKKSDFLFSAFAQHSVKNTLEFFNSRGMKTKVENESRVFPISNSAHSVYDILVKYMKENNVDVVTDFSAKNIHAQDGKIVGVNTAKDTIIAKSYILATGGVSHPETGSTGEALEWLEKIGHKINKSDIALVPVKTKEKWVHELAGVSNQHAGLSIYVDGKKTQTSIGRMVFAHFGLSGPLVLNMSVDIRDSMKWSDKVEISLDFFPDFTLLTLDMKIQQVFKEYQNKKLKNMLRALVQPALVETIIKLAKLDGEKEVNIVSREERLALGKRLKDLRMTPIGFQDFKKSIVASGGVAPEEIDFHTMQSRLFSNLYLIGDILDIERPSGGFSLQICWTTGFVAGTHSANHRT